MSDLYNNVKVTRALSPISITTGVTAGIVVDTSAYRSTTFMIAAGVTSSIATPIIKSGTATGSLTSEADSNLIGTESGAIISATGDNTQSKIGYKGSNRYANCSLSLSAGTGVYSVVCVQADPIKAPVS